MISVRNVSKRFGTQVVLDGVSLEIRPGQTTAVVGPSGVGKSVLLKMILGIMQPDQGEILIHDRSITAARNVEERNEIRACIGVLFQSAALFDSQCVYENVAFPLRVRSKLGRGEIHEKVGEMLQSLSLQQNALNFPQEISLGMRKRVGLARALITEPDIVLFDEPNTGLDPLVGQEVYDLIRECKVEWGFTGVVISHELPEVFQVSDRVAMILKGKIICEGTPAEFCAADDVAVQQFLHGRIDGPIRIQ